MYCCGSASKSGYCGDVFSVADVPAKADTDEDAVAKYQYC